jgi:alcohol dehydrogenase YqhD (iron-dependent ADH family)
MTLEEKLLTKQGLKSIMKDFLYYAPTEVVFGKESNPRLSLAQQGIELCRKEHVDFVLAVGGGSVIESQEKAKTLFK